MRITVVAVGKLKERFWKDAVAEYAKRLGAFCTLKLVEVPDRDPGASGGAQRARELEAHDIFKACGESHVIVLAIQGKQRSSEEVAAHLDSLMTCGTSDITFVIGGSTGVSQEVMARADEALSLGPVTLPHNLARVVLLEQIYRAFKIIHGQPYHK